MTAPLTATDVSNIYDAASAGLNHPPSIVLALCEMARQSLESPRYAQVPGDNRIIRRCETCAGLVEIPAQLSQVRVEGCRACHAEDEKDKAREEIAKLKAERDALHDEREEWQSASGLECGGDPGGVTPKMLEEFIAELVKERDEARARADAAKSALISMCEQYLSVQDGKLHHDFMSAGEEAFEVLGWPDTGHPLDKSALCEVEGCGYSWSCGIPDGEVYHRFCGRHYQEYEKAKGAGDGGGG